jgi:hypothetical protein
MACLFSVWSPMESLPLFTPLSEKCAGIAQDGADRWMTHSCLRGYLAEQWPILGSGRVVDIDLQHSRSVMVPRVHRRIQGTVGVGDVAEALNKLADWVVVATVETLALHSWRPLSHVQSPKPLQRKAVCQHTKIGPWVVIHPDPSGSGLLHQAADRLVGEILREIAQRRIGCPQLPNQSLLHLLKRVAVYRRSPKHIATKRRYRLIKIAHLHDCA